MTRKSVMDPGSTIKAGTRVIRALKAKPLSIKALMVEARVSDHSARRWTRGLHAAGLLRVSVEGRQPGQFGSAPFIWEWVP